MVRNIAKYSLGFQLLIWVVKPFYRLFYRRLKVVGRENIPRNVPIIFIANHQNSLMDALSIIYATGNRQIVFLARADIFKQKLVARLLYFIKIMPVYRLRDGMENMSQNDGTFELVKPVLESRRAIGIFPEGTQSEKYQLKIFKKGLCRIAFPLEELSNFQLNTTIVPVGLAYSDWYSRNADLLINIGKPIKLSDYAELYKQNQPKAYSEFMQVCETAVSSLTWNIRTNDFYDTTIAATTIYLNEQKRKNKLQQRFAIQQRIAISIAKQERNDVTPLKLLQEKITKYAETLSQKKLSDKAMRKNKNIVFHFLALLFGLICLLPFSLIGLITNGLPYVVASTISRKVKDKGFITTFNFALWFLLSAIYYPLLFCAIGFLFGWLNSLFSFPVIIFCGLLTFLVNQWFQRLLIKWQQFKTHIFAKNKNKEIVAQHAEIIKNIENLMNQ